MSLLIEQFIYARLIHMLSHSQIKFIIFSSYLVYNDNNTIPGSIRKIRQSFTIEYTLYIIINYLSKVMMIYSTNSQMKYTKIKPRGNYDVFFSKPGRMTFHFTTKAETN